MKENIVDVGAYTGKKEIKELIKSRIRKAVKENRG